MTTKAERIMNLEQHKKRKRNNILVCAHCGKEFESYLDRNYCYECSEDGIDLYES